ncbi:MAG: carboxypeptidase-like regulatory domain-containing protein, partial [Macellibacteroides fermentans]
MMKSQFFKWSLLITLFFWTQWSYAQQVPIQGTVISETDNLPIIGASVIEKGTTNGTITDLDGNFTLNASSGSVIQISYVGYLTQELPVKGIPKQI